jgi:hypothetical protein
MPLSLRGFFAAFVACLAVSAAAQDSSVSGEDFRKAVTNKKIFARSSNGQLMDLSMRDDQSAQVSIGNMNDTGTWRSTPDGYCAKWNRIRAGEERCFTVVRRGGTMVVLNPDKTVSAEILRMTD